MKEESGSGEGREGRGPRRDGPDGREGGDDLDGREGGGLEQDAPGAGPRRRPERWIARLSRCLRAEGVPCAVTESVAARSALHHLDLGDSLDAYFGLRSVFLPGRRHGEAWDRCFWSLWGGRGAREREPEGQDGGEMTREGSGEGRGSQGEVGSSGGGGEEEEPAALARLRSPGEGRGDAGGEAGGDEASEGALRAAYSPHESLGERSFASLTEVELRELDRVFDRLTLRLPARRSRRYRPSRRRGRADVRRSFRDALRHDGELIRLARRRRRREPPELVLLCDVSGSMERYSRFLVRFVLAAARERRVETFVFGTRLTRLTPWLSALPVEEALEVLADRVPDWSGGTRIGESLETFVEEHGRRLLGGGSVVVIMSDGLDRGEIAPLERAMRRIHRSARKVIWLNPLMGSPDYAPEARGMKAALPYVDELAPGHSLESLREAVRMIGR